MFKAFASLLFITIFAAVTMAQDPVKVDANHYKVEFENAQVRVLRVKVGPGEKSIMHQHPNAVAIFMTDANNKFTFPDGKVEDRSGKAGQVLWTPATVHQPENVGAEAFEVILVELKGKPPATTSNHSNRRLNHRTRKSSR